MSESPATNILRAARNLMLRVAPPPSTWASFRNIIFASCLRTSTFRFSTNADRLLASRVERTPDLHSHLSAYPDFLLFGALPIPSIHHQWALNFAVKDNAALTFLFSLLAIIPLAKLLGFATDELSMRVGQPLASLLNVTLGNTVELVIAVLALVKCELGIVQSSLTGSLLVNLLVRLGVAFFANGIRQRSQGSNPAVRVQLKAALLIIGVITILLPVTHILAELSEGPADHTQEQGEHDLLLSRLVATILLLTYFSFLVFHFWSHAGQQSNTSISSAQNTVVPPSEGSRHDPEIGNGRIQNVSEEERKTPRLSVGMSMALLVLATAFISLVGECLVQSIDGLTKRGNVSKEFVSLFLLQLRPVVELFTAAVTDDLPSSVAEAVDFGAQIAFFVSPFVVLLGWLLGKPLTLLLDPYEALSLFLASLAVTYVMQDNKSNWLEGMLLICLYTVLGVTFWFYTGAPDIAVLQLCT